MVPFQDSRPYPRQPCHYPVRRCRLQTHRSPIVPGRSVSTLLRVVDFFGDM